MSKSKSTKLVDATIGEFTEALIRGNGFGHESLWIKNAFGGTKISVIEETIGQYAHNICQNTMTKYFEEELGYKPAGTTFYDESGECAVTYENMQIGLDQHTKIFKNALITYSKGDDKICISINSFGPREIHYRLFAKPGSENILMDWIRYSRKNNLYRGKKIDAECNFLKLSDVKWDDIILEPKTIDVVRSHVDELFIYSDYLKANNMNLKRGVILSGPPGTGKTMLAKVLAKEIDGTVIYALPSHLENAVAISRVCEMAKDLSPCMLIIEDIDWIAENRDESYNAGSVIQLMNYLDGLQEFTDVVTLATTNNADKIEDAMKNRPGRFDRLIKVPKPNTNCRKRMLAAFTKGYKMVDVDFEPLISETKDLSGAHIKDLCKTAALMAIRSKSVDENKKVILTQDHFDKSLSEIRNVDYSTVEKIKNSTRKVGFGAELDL